jgi:hypothetical protein
MPSRSKIIVFGILFWYPLAGVTYQFLHYLLGLRRLGHDPYYVEDSGRYVYDPLLDDTTPDATRNIEAVAPVLEAHGLGDRWAFRGAYPGGRCYGLTEQQLLDLYGEADAFLNVTGAQEIREEHLRVGRRIYVESDPVACQIKVFHGDAAMIAALAAHDTHFTFGENLGRPDCRVPVERFRWMPTRQPVLLDLWDSPDPGPGSAYSTIASWHSRGKDIKFKGETYYWSKDREFAKVLDLPRRRRVPFEVAMATPPDVRERLGAHGWSLRNPLEISRDPQRYRDFILRSRAEFTVAKDQYVRLRSGWFSDRSACYLAASRPVITQDTAFGNILPTGRGLFSFQGMDDILAAVDEIESRYEANRRAAREIAEEYFAAEKVLGSLLSRAGL